MSASSNESKGWSPWGWSAVEWGAGLTYSAGLGALFGDQFDLAAILFVVAIVWVTVKVLTLPEAKWSFAPIVAASFLCILHIWWVQFRVDSMAERHPNSPQASAPQAPLVMWKTPSSIEAGRPLSERELNASASFGGKSVDGRFVYNPALGATLPVGSDTLSVTFYPTDSTKYSTQTQTTTLIVNPPRINSPGQSTLPFHGVVQPPLSPPTSSQITCQQAIEVCSTSELIQRAFIMQQRLKKFADDWRAEEESERTSVQQMEELRQRTTGDNKPIVPLPPNSSPQETEAYRRRLGFESWLQKRVLDVMDTNAKKYNDQFRTDALQIRNELVNRYPPGRTLAGYSEYDRVVQYQQAYAIVRHLGTCMDALRNKP